MQTFEQFGAPHVHFYYYEKESKVFGITPTKKCLTGNLLISPLYF